MSLMRGQRTGRSHREHSSNGVHVSATAPEGQSGVFVYLSHAKECSPPPSACLTSPDPGTPVPAVNTHLRRQTSLRAHTPLPRAGKPARTETVADGYNIVSNVSLSLARNYATLSVCGSTLMKSERRHRRRCRLGLARTDNGEIRRPLQIPQWARRSPEAESRRNGRVWRISAVAKRVIGGLPRSFYVLAVCRPTTARPNAVSYLMEPSAGRAASGACRPSP